MGDIISKISKSKFTIIGYRLRDTNLSQSQIEIINLLLSSLNISEILPTGPRMDQEELYSCYKSRWNLNKKYKFNLLKDEFGLIDTKLFKKFYICLNGKDKKSPQNYNIEISDIIKMNFPKIIISDFREIGFRKGDCDLLIDIDNFDIKWNFSNKMGKGPIKHQVIKRQIKINTIIG